MTNPHAVGTIWHPNVLGGVLGNVLEWYDFAVYGYFAPIIGAQFFPQEDPLTQLISAYGIFAVGYLMRPIGGAIFGTIGDRTGRKRALQLSILLMAVPTTLIGLLPTYAQWGLWAPILLMLLRMVQGISVGGELIGSISFMTETAPPQRRGFFGSLAFSTGIAGILLGSFVATLFQAVFDPTTLAQWGWRLAFIVAVLVAGVGFWMRKGMSESPEFEQAKATLTHSQNPVIQVMKTMPGRVFRLTGLVATIGGGFYTLFVWWPTYLTKIVDPPVPHALMANTISMVVLVGLIPIGGWLCDRFTAKKVFSTSLLALMFLTYPLFLVTDHGIFSQALIAQLIFTLAMSGAIGAAAAVMVDLFPTRSRFSGIGVGYNLGQAILGGTAPMVCTWLVQSTGQTVAPAFYLILLTLISFIAITTVRAY